MMGCFWCKSKCGSNEKENPYQTTAEIALSLASLNQPQTANTLSTCKLDSPPLYLPSLRNGLPSGAHNSQPNHPNVIFSISHENHGPDNFINHNSSYINRCECDVRAGEDLSGISKCDSSSHNHNHNHNHNNHNPPEPGIDVPDGEVPGPSHEIFYNKISVREPLYKVLAERALIEHHYTEVDEEGTSCFYEEIAGSTNSSVTYTKIGDLTHEDQNNPSVVLNVINSPSSRPPPPSVESLMVVAESSRSTSPQSHQDQSNHSPQPPSGDTSSTIDPRISELYAFVDKSAKKSNINDINNVDQLYAKVQKNTSHKQSNKGISSDSGVSRIEAADEFFASHNHHIINPDVLSGSSRPNLKVSNKILNGPFSNAKGIEHIRSTNSATNSAPSPLIPPPPPPPPPLPTLNSMPSRSGRTISLYDNPIQPRPSLIPGHSRRHSFGCNSNFNLKMEECAIEDPGYEVVGSGDRNVDSFDNTEEPEADPGYEPIRMSEISHHNMVSLIGIALEYS